jgi:1-acyl-sn-glycerol-3-phosphate acyltransferase
MRGFSVYAPNVFGIYGIFRPDYFRLKDGYRVHYTIFDTPILSYVLRRSARIFLRIFGWRMEGQAPEAPKCVMIAAPHTSNWDLPVMLFFAFAFRKKLFFMVKDAVFRWPFGPLFRWLGGIPIDRSQRNGVVEQSIQAFRDNQELILVVPPSGTRSKVEYWKTGFYHIARGADVPIALGFLDYGRKRGGVGPTIVPTGDIEEDMKEIRVFYAGITAKYPEKSSLSTAVSLD